MNHDPAARLNVGQLRIHGLNGARWGIGLKRHICIHPGIISKSGLHRFTTQSGRGVRVCESVPFALLGVRMVHGKRLQAAEIVVRPFPGVQPLGGLFLKSSWIDRFLPSSPDDWRQQDDIFCEAVVESFIKQSRTSQ